MRVAIVQRKARMRNAEVPDAVAHLIAERVDSNIRELEGAVVKVLGVAAITDRPITLALAEEALSGMSAPRPRRVSVDDVMSLITNEFSISIRDVIGKSRIQAVSLPRQVGMWLCRQHTENSLEEVGRRFGDRDHTTVLYAVNKVKRRSEEEPSFGAMLEKLSKRLVSGQFERRPYR
jgi:chromosomal replication initiator protein